MRNWLLPEKFEDILPPQAQRIDRMRAKLLELFRVHGYELVIPPMLEYLESLLTGTGHDLDLRTFKLVDQLSGRMMGLRADITPQVARIDARLPDRKGVTRLCYAGSVLLTRPRGLDSTREPLQIGAEIYGHAAIESDLEIQALLVQALAACGVSGARLDIGHVAVFRAVCRHGGVGPELESELYEALSAKDLPALRAVTRRLAGAPGHRIQHGSARSRARCSARGGRGRHPRAALRRSRARRRDPQAAIRRGDRRGRAPRARGRARPARLRPRAREARRQVAGTQAGQELKQWPRTSSS